MGTMTLRRNQGPWGSLGVGMREEALVGPFQVDPLCLDLEAPAFL